MPTIFVLDQIELLPGKLAEFREALDARYLPAASKRGLRFVDAWLTPPLDLHDAGNELLLLWSLPDIAGFWEMRRLQGEDPESERWWHEVSPWIASRSRRFMTREPLAAQRSPATATER